MSSGLWVVACDGGNVLTSPDAAVWTERTVAGSPNRNDVAWSPELELFVLVGDSGTILTSPDGITWTARTSPVSTSLRSVVWSPELGLFVTSGLSGTIVTSPDGVGWTQRTSGTTGNMRGLAWSPTLELFAAEDGNNFRTSPDGVTWTARDGNGGSANIVWADSLGLFIAAGASNSIQTSDDGVTWTSRPNRPATGTWTGVAWLASAGVAIVTGGVDDQSVYRSTDGVNWSSVGFDPSNSLRDSFGANGLFVVSSSNNIFTSSDGSSFTARATPGSENRNGIAFAQFNVPPNAPVLDDPGVINRNVTNRLRWTFSDDDAGDSQSQYTVQIRLQGETATVVDVTNELTDEFYDLPGGTLAAGLYEWRVRTRDALGEQGPYSSWEPFEATTPPAGPTLTAPVNDGTIGTEEFTVEWSASEQDAYQLRRLGDAAGSPDTDNILFDTGQVNSSGARSRLVSFPTNNQTEHVQVRVLRNSLWSPYSTVRVNVSYTPPETPTAVLAVNTPAGAITVSATNPTPGTGVPAVESFRVFRRVVGDPGDGIRLAVNRPPSGSFVDWSVASGADLEYRVQAMGDNGTSTFSAWQS